MKQIKTGKREMNVTPVFYLYAALLLLIFPVQWVFALSVSMAVHELGHFVALRLMRVPIRGMIIRPAGVQMLTASVGPVKEMAAAAAGPILGLSLVFLGRWMPGLALIAVFHSLFNLLPIYPGDGGRVFRSFCRLIFPHAWAEKISDIVGIGTALLLAALAVYGTIFMKLGLLPLALGVWLIVNAVKNRK